MQVREELDELRTQEKKQFHEALNKEQEDEDRREAARLERIRNALVDINLRF